MTRGEAVAMAGTFAVTAVTLFFGAHRYSAAVFTMAAVALTERYARRCYAGPLANLTPLRAFRADAEHRANVQLVRLRSWHVLQHAETPEARLNW